MIPFWTNSLVRTYAIRTLLASGVIVVAVAIVVTARGRQTDPEPDLAAAPEPAMETPTGPDQPQRS